MRRDPFDPHIADLTDAGTLPPPASEELVRVAHAHWLNSLRKNGNHPGPNHQDAGWQLLRAMVDQLYGVRTGRFAYAVPCGGGKTQAVVALLSAMFTLGLFGSKTVLVVAQEVKALSNIKRKLLEAGLPERAVGIVHGKTDAAYPSTGDEKRPIMLATHARVQRDGSLPECCRNGQGLLHDLVIWDEALMSAEAVCLGLAPTLTALGHFAERCATVGKASERLRLAAYHERAGQEAGRAACELTPLITEEEADLIDRELQAVGYLDKTELVLKEQALHGTRLVRNAFSLVDPRNGQSAGLMRYAVKVTDMLSNIVILDASHAIDELRQADRTIRAGTTEAMTNFKDFSTVTAIHYPVASGRSTIKADGKAVLQAVRIAKELPDHEPVLFVTFKDWHERRLIADLQEAGVPVVLGESSAKSSRRVITWGKHTSDNSYTHCKHVVLVGLHRLPLVSTASQLAAQRRDLTHRLDKGSLLSLEQSVIAGNAMQAMNRGCMRLTDAEGMAHPMTVHIIAKDDLRPVLGKAMPGLRWETAAVKQPTRTEDAARQITEYLMAFPQTETGVSTRRLYADCGISPGKDLRSAALAEALFRL